MAGDTGGDTAGGTAGPCRRRPEGNSAAGTSALVGGGVVRAGGAVLLTVTRHSVTHRGRALRGERWRERARAGSPRVLPGGISALERDEDHISRPEGTYRRRRVPDPTVRGQDVAEPVSGQRAGVPLVSCSVPAAAGTPRNIPFPFGLGVSVPALLSPPWWEGGDAHPCAVSPGNAVVAWFGGGTWCQGTGTDRVPYPPVLPWAHRASSHPQCPLSPETRLCPTVCHNHRLYHHRVP